MIKTQNLIISQAVNMQEISILTGQELYILDPKELEDFMINCIQSGKAEKFEL